MKYILWISVAVLAGIYICGPVVDPDLWWHITSGRWILANHQVPVTDHWNMFALGKPWIAYSWSNEILFALVDSAFSIKGLLVLKLLLAVAFSLSLAYCLGKTSGDWFVGGLFGVYSVLACFSHFTLRPQSFVWIYFVWLLYCCDRVSRRGLSLPLAASIFVLMSLWANTHLSSVLGIAAIAAWLLPSVSFSMQELKPALKAVLIGFCGTLLTPYFGAEWLTFFHKSAHPFLYGAIIEFGPATILQYATVFMLLMIVVGAAFLARRPALAGCWRITASGVFVLGALAVVKFLPFAMIFGAFVIARAWSAAGGRREELGNLAEAIGELGVFFNKIPREGLSFVMICMSIVLVNRLWVYPLDLVVTPESAVNFIQGKGLPHPLLNTFGQGGYVMYRFSDAGGNLAHPVPIDGRTNVNPPEVWKKHDTALNGRPGWEEFLEMVKPETILWNPQSPLVSILKAGGQWCVVFRQEREGKGAVVLVTRRYFEQRSGDLKSENCA